MNANASWGQPPSTQANASWDVPSASIRSGGAKSAIAASLLVGKDKKTLAAMFKMSLQNQKATTTSKSNMTSPKSTSALSNMMLRPPDASNLRVRSKASIAEYNSQDNAGWDELSSDVNHEKFKTVTGTRLRNETLVSLGIEIKKPKGELRGCMKKGKGLKRASTLSSFREISAAGPDGIPIKRNISITFKETVDIKRVPSASSLANSPQELWFQDREQREIRKTAKALVQIVDESNVDPSLLDLHGLEGHTRIRKKISQARIYDTWDAVLDAQDIARQQGGSYNDEEIASMIRTVSAQSLQDAQERARQYFLA